MRNGKSQKPFISERAVRTALDALVYSTKDKQNLLLSLTLVDHFLLDPDIPLSSRRREFALSHILTSTVTAEFANRLAIYGQTAPPLTSSRETILTFISELSQFQSPDLIGWSWLYHHYVAVNHNITLSEFTTLNHIDERTLRRYQHQALTQLTDQLIEQEWSVCIQHRHRQLYAELPSMGVLSLEGRQAEYEYINRYLREQPPAHIQLVGGAGIGKSALAEVVVRGLIRDDLAHVVVWISRPPSVQYIEQYLVERLLPDEAKFTLREYMLIHPVVVVVDDFEPSEDISLLNAALQSLATAIVIFTTHHALPLPHTAVVRLGELVEHDARKLILRTLKNAKMNLDDRALLRHGQSVWEAAGGNPQAIFLVTSAPSLFDFPGRHDAGLNALYDGTYQRLDKDARYAWSALALLPPQRYTFDELFQFWPAQFAPEILAKLVQAQVVETLQFDSLSATYHLTNSARRYLEDRYAVDDMQKETVSQLLSHVVNSWQLRVAEYVLTSNWIDMDAQERVGWIRKWHKQGIPQHHWSIWRLLLEPYAQAGDPDLLMGYATCLRGLGEWLLAHQSLEFAISSFGRAGRFTEQASAFVELSVILRYQGEYTRAIALLERAQRIASRYRINDLREAIILEQAQIAVDLKDTMTARSLMAELPENEQRGQFLASEIHLLIGDFQQSRLIALRLLDELEGASIVQSRIHTLLGRIYELEGDLERSLDHFLVAYSKLDTQKDMFGFARTQTNLGAILIKNRDYTEAEELLTAAETTQTVLNDRVGLAATQHNLRLLNIALNS